MFPQPQVGFALQGRDAMKHPKRGQSFVSQTMVFLWICDVAAFMKRFSPKLSINQMSEENSPSVLFYSCLPTPEPIVEIKRFLKTNSKSGEFGPL
jgi:hypothetical protein